VATAECALIGNSIKFLCFEGLGDHLSWRVLRQLIVARDGLPKGFIDVVPDRLIPFLGRDGDFDHGVRAVQGLAEGPAGPPSVVRRKGVTRVLEIGSTGQLGAKSAAAPAIISIYPVKQTVDFVPDYAARCGLV
jgi:hypothetical protein